MTDEAMEAARRIAAGVPANVPAVFGGDAVLVARALLSGAQPDAPLREALEKIAAQRFSQDIPDDEVDDADFTGAYDTMISEAHAALNPSKEIDKTDLMPCPFCGGEAFRSSPQSDPGSTKQYREIGCSQCGVRTGLYSGDAEIIQWNRRATLKADP